MLFLLYAWLAGALSAFAFEPTALWPLLPIGFALLCEFVSRSTNLWRALLTGWLFGLGQFIVGLNWIATAFTYQSAMPAWLGWVAVVLLSLYLAVYPAMATGLAWRLARNDRVALAAGLAGAWAITEWLRGTMFTGFPWNPAAAALAPTPLIGVTALIGTYGLSALVALIGGAIWLGCHRKWLPFVMMIGATALACVLPASTVPADRLAVVNLRVVQPNIGQEAKWRSGYEGEAVRRLEALSPRNLSRPHLLLWPEAAVTEPLQDGRTDGHQAFAQLERAAVSSPLGPNDLLLTGGIAIDSKDGTRVSGAENSIFVIGPGGQMVSRYDKSHLVPYGEYLPMRPLLSLIGLSRLAPGDFDFTPGPGPRTVDLGGEWGKVGFDLCYEIIFPAQVVDENNRPSFIFNPSNDAWFGRWGPPQHLAQARLRAAEEGIPVVRSTPTGISAVIDARGRLVKTIPWRVADVIETVLPPAASRATPFARGGNAIPVVLGFLLVIGGIVLGRRRR